MQGQIADLQAAVGIDTSGGGKRSTVETLVATFDGAAVNIARLQNDVADAKDVDSAIFAALQEDREVVETNAENVKTGLESLDNAIVALSQKVDKIASDGSTTLVTCPAINVENSLLHESVAKFEHVVGFSVDVLCTSGYYMASGISSVTCFPGGKYCDSGKFGKESCDASEKPTCKPCPQEDCETCSAKTCTKCKKGKFLAYGKCTAVSTSCKKLYDEGKLKDGALRVELLTPKGCKTVEALCIVVDGQAHTHIECDKLAGGRECVSINKVQEENTCTQFGLHHSPVRSRNHYIALLAAMGNNWTTIENYWKTPGGIYGTVGGKNYSPCEPFSDKSSCASDWKSVDGKEWFIYNRRYSVYDNGGSALYDQYCRDNAIPVCKYEPNGDYNRGCYLGNHFGAIKKTDSESMKNTNGWVATDKGCEYSTGAYYMCGMPEY
jgi:hypothetical protein